MKTVKLTLGYLGEKYNGWQVQSKQTHTSTIQQELQVALKKLTNEDIKVTGAGRTDAGVNALGQVAVFSTTSSIPYNKFPDALNSILPDDIIVYKGEAVEQDFHPIRDAVGKWYRYSIYTGAYPHVFYNKISAHYKGNLDVNAMIQGANYFIGTHNFKSFCSTKTTVKNFVRNIKDCKITTANQFIFIDLYADGFLYNMVRIIVGTLLEVGRGKLPPTKIKKIIEAEKRELAGPTAPAKGLCLIRVDYEEIKENYFCKADSLDMPILFY